MVLSFLKRPREEGTASVFPVMPERGKDKGSDHPLLWRVLWKKSFKGNQTTMGPLPGRGGGVMAVTHCVFPRPAVSIMRQVLPWIYNTFLRRENKGEQLTERVFQSSAALKTASRQLCLQCTDSKMRCELYSKAPQPLSQLTWNYLTAEFHMYK